MGKASFIMSHHGMTGEHFRTFFLLFRSEVGRSGVENKHCKTNYKVDAKKFIPGLPEHGLQGGFSLYSKFAKASSYANPRVNFACCNM